MRYLLICIKIQAHNQDKRLRHSNYMHYITVIPKLPLGPTLMAKKPVRSWRRILGYQSLVREVKWTSLISFHPQSIKSCNQ